MQNSSFTGHESNLDDWVRDRIAVLRPRLLDLTRRNPLLSTKLNPRSNSYIRVVDELPDVLAFELKNNNAMRFDPLPKLDSDPKDEDTGEFRSAFAEAQRTDEEYIEATSELSSGDAESEERTRQLDRQLKDKVRETLDMPPRETSGDISLEKHARLHHISPHYDLPLLNDEHDDGRHRDDAIQTLLLPDQLERKLNGLITKCNTWVQETGINVLQAAFGFLEWQDNKSTKSALAPLVLMPAGIKKKKTQDGPEFWIKGSGEECETNLILAEMLKREFDLELPPYDGGSIEEYFEEVANLNPNNLKKFVVRRQVVFGVFPSARMAMYHDLDPDKHALHQAPIVSQLLGGADTSSGATPFADEHDVEAPEVEAKIPCLITEADSSQLSALVDLAEGKSIAVEGPPGTGKSQTIVNAIAAAIADGKKVLFVAEKMAALEVVKSRLEALGLSEFLLPLQAERSTREQVIASVRDRMEMPRPRAPREYDEKLDEFRRVRANLNAYVETISTEFGPTGMTIYEVLGKAISAHSVLEGRTDVFVRPPIGAPERISKTELQQVIDAARLIDELSEELAGLPDCWSQSTPERTDKLELDQIRQLAVDAATACDEASGVRFRLPEYDIAGTTAHAELEEAKSLLDQVRDRQEMFFSDVFARLCAQDDRTAIETFVDDCEQYQSVISTLSNVVCDPRQADIPQNLKELASLTKQNGFETLDTELLRARMYPRALELRELSTIAKAIEPLVDEIEDFDDFPLDALRQARDIIGETRREVLALRNPAFESPEAGRVIRKAASDAQALRAMLSSVEERMTIPADITSGQLRSCAADLDKAGLFSMFSSDVRFANRTLRGLCKGKPPKGKDASAALRAIAQFKDAHQAFLDDPTYKHCFGLHFAGFETDFGLFEELIDFYEKVELSLRGAGNRACRKLLREGRIETLFELPELEPASWQGRVGELDAHLQDELSVLERAQNAIARIETLANIFHRPADISNERLQEVALLAIEGVEARAAAEQNAPAKQVLGESFEGADSDVELIRFNVDILTQVEALPSIGSALEAVLSGPEWLTLRQELGPILAADANVFAMIDVLGERSGRDFEATITDCNFASAAYSLACAAKDEQGLSANVRLSKAFSNLDELGFGWVPRSIVEELAGSDLSLAMLLEASIYRSMSSKIMDQHGDALNRYQGRELNQMRAKLAKLDKQLLSLSRKKLRALATSKANPPSGVSSGPKRDWTEYSLLENETAKQKRFVPVRDLTQRAGRALQELKPCWMMSPLAVAQYLPAQAIRFDLCIIDEASQMKPEDALGALARCDQAMVVGDVNQLPPSNFFQKMVADDEDDEEGAAVDEESILEISNARLRPNRRLRWHYRSQSSDLIRFSNELIYDSNLVIFPSSDEQRPDMGVSLVPVQGLYHNSVNPIEAKTIVEATLRFMRERPGESLGIVTLNQKQRDLIIDEMNFAVESNEFASRYIDDWAERNDGLERFFIKNLENVQGDERDVIFIGTVYGPAREGAKPMQRFGPINGAAGRRRLNVLFTRAKKQIVTFSSLKPSDITASENSNPGTYMLKRWLEYSATKILERTDDVYAETDSDFEDYVIQQIKAMGCEAVPQVGCAGYRIDIGVKHPEWPYGFVLAVECDGAAYHSCRASRDRDRLRQEVLERLGWTFHRIWSTDWFNDPRAETERLRDRITQRLSELRELHLDRVPLPDTLPQVDPQPEPIFANDDVPDPLRPTSLAQASECMKRSTDKTSCIEVGDTVRVTYLSGNKASLQVTISQNATKLEEGIIAAHEPLAEALLGAEQGEEVEVLVGSYVRKALVEQVKKVA